MRVPHPQVATRTAVSAARSRLALLTASVGTSGLAAASARPALLALVDQHAAAIRDSLDGDRRPLTPAALAGYAEGIRDTARAHGLLPDGATDFTAPDWVLIRLLAVCALARTLDPRHLEPA
ncbi:DUF6401 family natural product biosynthesis protein [Micromonospora sp. NPDC051925]|uniref:DUF6401 family natural product biosynthesis protein n=1 Tax=Micromonospora sp. NPDC051925 TaxID=3364288 RepID=UPI0037C66ECB